MIDSIQQELVQRGFIVTGMDGRAIGIRGFSEETIAMLFALYSRSGKDLIVTVSEHIAANKIAMPDANPEAPEKRVRTFHDNVTIGYGHKSVGDHATLHYALEGVSLIASRDFLSARLLAATEQSTRFISMDGVGYVIPPDMPEAFADQYEDHCTRLMGGYSGLMTIATEAVREIFPYDDAYGWKNIAGWESATEKRALDMVRDLLPASTQTRLGVSASATATREILDKRRHLDPRTTLETVGIAEALNDVCHEMSPSLIPTKARIIPRHPVVAASPFDFVGPSRADKNFRVPIVRLVMKPSWQAVQELIGIPASELIVRWTTNRAHHMVPDRTAEAAVYGFHILMPWAIHRELGRHRMKTDLDGELNPSLGYMGDPLLLRFDTMMKSNALQEVAKRREVLLTEADVRLRSWWSSGVPVSALQYGCPIATAVPVKWVLNVRELVHILGLRTTPQVHPLARGIIHAVAKAVEHHDPIMAPLVRSVTNYTDVIVGRPG